MGRWFPSGWCEIILKVSVILHPFLVWFLPSQGEGVNLSCTASLEPGAFTSLTCHWQHNPSFVLGQSKSLEPAQRCHKSTEKYFYAIPLQLGWCISVHYAFWPTLRLQWDAMGETCVGLSRKRTWEVMFRVGEGRWRVVLGARQRWIRSGALIWQLSLRITALEVIWLQKKGK